MKNSFFFVLFIIVLAGCSVSKKTSLESGNKTSTNVLTEIKFSLILFDGKEIDSGRVYFTLSSAENRFFGRGFCNSFNGQYFLKGSDTIKFNNMVSTKMACPELDAENEFFSMLKQIDSYRFEGKTLLLKSSDNVRAVFSAE
ncbi:MAG: META domain-containing protein [Prolixibacteraceae bacterium]|nr:META domain-containing protein [Prolixibacteraceae bacterium]MBN2648735.1 META domain-containing protein [Prolixibacteraceae bacterium]